MKITNLNPDANIGASAWFVEMDNHRILLDAGTHPKREGRDALPLYRLIENEEVDAIAITHCHHDHVGSLPIAMRHFPNAHVLLPELSYLIIDRVLHNSVNVMKRQREELGIREYPLYSHEEVEGNSAHFQGYKYNREVEWAAFTKQRSGKSTVPTLEFFDAGHTLGSAGVLLRSKGQSLFYTGDVCFHDQTILRGARFNGAKADVLVMETTRGNRAVVKGVTRDTEVERLIAAVAAAVERKGCVLIPTFALGRTQEVLTMLALAMQAGRLRRQPIFIGGLGRVFTEIYDLESHKTHRQHADIQIHEKLQLTVLEQGQAEKMRLAGGHIFVVTAGMMSEKTAAHDLAARMIGDERQSIFFVGYADPDTPGGRLKAAKPGETFIFSAGAGEVTVKCAVDDFDLTAHANRDDLMNFVGEVNPRTILLGHGDTDARQWFEEQIHARWPQIKVFQPAPGKVVEA